MAKFNPTIGTLSGKTGGLIYAFNRGGFYQRNYVKQVWAGTPAQVTAKNFFVASNSYWNSLSDIQKTEWNTFAKLFYNPLYAKSNVEYNGHDAAIAAQMTASMTNSMKRTFTLLWGSHSSVVSSSSLLLGTDAPSYRLGTLINDTNNNPVAITFSNVVFNANGSGTMYFTMNNFTNKALRLTEYINNGKIGFCFYCSNGLKVNQKFYKRPLYFLMGSTGIISSNSIATIPSYNTFSIQFALGLTTTNYKLFPVSTDKVRITAYIYNLNGQKALVGSLDTVVV